MTTLGQLCLLGAFVACGYASFASLAGWRRAHRRLAQSGVFAAAVGVAMLTTVTAVLAWALLAKDFRFAYVAQYSSRLLPWHYALSALWGGQAGSLLLWAWLLGMVLMVFRFWPTREPSQLRDLSFGVLLAYLWFLVAMMVFAADPMAPSISVAQEGAGLAPVLQHPAMLVHPPVVFLGYACWAIPLALAAAALIAGRLDTGWVRQARPWALCAWIASGLGILLGAYWAYEELGWGGYWSWDPVENGSLLPWLTGTALMHVLLAWQHRRVLKKTALWLAVVTFGLCNFAAFLTRSGIFGGLHAFSQSPIGWMFLALLVGLCAAVLVLTLLRRTQLAGQQPIASIWSREALVVLATVALLLLAATVLAGTLAAALPDIVFGRRIAFGTAFYGNVLMPIGVVLLATTAAAPLLRWGASPTPTQRRMLLLSLGGGGVAAALAFALGARHPIALAVAWLTGWAAFALAAAVLLDARQRKPAQPWLGLLASLATGRRQYAGWLIHLGFFCLAAGATGSSLGSRQHEAVISEGDTAEWAGYSIRYTRLIQRKLPDRFVVEAQLDVSRHGASAFTLLPAQHLHLLQNQWATEVAIHSTWMGDFYAILHSGKGRERISLTLCENPMMRWLWLAGWVAGLGALIRLWPARYPFPKQSSSGISQPRKHETMKTRKQVSQKVPVFSP